MTMLRVVMARVRGLFREPGLDEEIATHISLAAAEYERRGMTPEQAHLEARRQFGGVTQIRETYRDERGFRVIEGFLQDLTYALRQLRKSPLFASAAVLTLALGIGANTAVFRALDVLLLRSLPVRHASELVLLKPFDLGKPCNLTYSVYRDLASHTEVLRDGFAAGDVWHPKASIDGGEGLKVNQARLVTGGYFSTLGLDAAIGRPLSEADDRPDAPGVVVISFKLWEQAFGRSPSVIGKVLKINSTTATVVGVAPRGFQSERVLFQVDLWVPMSIQPRLMGSDWLRTENMSFLDMMARLKPGVSKTQAQAALDPVYQRLLKREPGRDRLEVQPGRNGITLEQIQDNIVEPLRVLMSMVAALLMIACCNLANLLLARGAARTHEIGVRLALGAGRGRLVRQLFTESLLLAGLGTAAGVLLAEWGVRVLAMQIDQDMDIGIDLGWRVLGFVAALSVLSTCVFGVAPALAGTRLDIRSALQGNWRVQSSGGRPRQRLGKAFVVAQVSICLMLLSGAALLARSLWNLERQDWGFRPQGLLMAELPVDMARDMAKERSQKLFATRHLVYEKVSALPGVQSAALVSGGPLGNDSWSSDVSIPGRSARNSDYARVMRVSPRYFETMGIQILQGRGLGEGDHSKAPHVVVLSQTAARRIFDGTNPIGQYISFAPEFEKRIALQVVGVARDVRLSSPREDPGVVVFAPLEQQEEGEGMPFNTVVLRTGGDPAALASTVRNALTEVSGDRVLGEVRPATTILSDQLDEEETLAEVAGGFGILALVMAAVGLYGVISYAVARRTQEMGIRLALGASGRQVMALVMGEVGVLLAGGLLVGSLGSVACARILRSLLYGITVRDSSWLVLAGLLLAIAAAVAGYVPARRAARLSPLDALRQE